MKLDLNAPALDRLLGGDTELEVHLREQVADQFAQKHLRSLLNDTVFNNWKKRVNEWTKDEIERHLNRTHERWRGEQVTLAAELQNRIRDRIDSEISAAIDSRVRTVVKRVEEQMIEKISDTFDSKRIEALVERGVAQRLEMAASLCRNGKEQRAIDLDAK